MSEPGRRLAAMLGSAILDSALLDLVLPLECGGCGAPSTRWCSMCATFWQVGTDEPHVVIPRIDPGVPVFALGRYAGPRRQAIVAVKERGRRDLTGPLSRALGLGIGRLLDWGVLQTPLTAVPAPTRRSAARRRGGDPVARIAAAAAAGCPEITVAPVLRTAALVRDSVGLSGADRERNIAGRVRLTATVPTIGGRDGEVLLVDDIVTTGATAREAVRTLACAGIPVAAVLALAHA